MHVDPDDDGRTREDLEKAARSPLAGGGLGGLGQ